MDWNQRQYLTSWMDGYWWNCIQSCHQLLWQFLFYQIVYTYMHLGSDKHEGSWRVKEDPDNTIVMLSEWVLRLLLWKLMYQNCPSIACRTDSQGKPTCIQHPEYNRMEWLNDWHLWIPQNETIKIASYDPHRKLPRDFQYLLSLTESAQRQQLKFTSIQV